MYKPDGIFRTGQIHHEVQKRIARARKLEMMEHPQVEQYISHLSNIGYNSSMIQQLDRILAGAYAYHLTTGDPCPEPSEHLVRGDYGIGHTKRSGFSCGISKKLQGGLLSGGQRESGKTTVNVNIGCQAMQDCPVWCIDVKDVDYRPLMYDNGLILELTDLRSNPLEPPPGVNAKEYASFFWGYFCEIFFERDTSRGILLNITDRLYSLYGVYEGKGIYPSLIDVRDELIRIRNSADPRGRQLGAIDSCLTRFNTIIYNIRPVIDISSGYPIKEMEQQSIDICIGSSNYECSVFPAVDLFCKVLCRRKAAYKRGEVLKPLLIIIDEAYYFFSRRLSQLGIPVLISELFVTQCREFNIALVLSTQSLPSLLMTVIDNMASKLILRQGSGESIYEAARVLGMNPEEARYIPRLKKYEGFLRKPDCQSIIHLDTKKPMVQKKLDPKKTEICRQRAFSLFKYRPRVPLKAMVEKRKAKGEASKLPIGYRPQDQVSKNARQLYVTVLKNLFCKITELCKIAGLSPLTGQRARQELINAGWIATEHKINLGRKGGDATFIELTDKGAKAMGLPLPQKPPGKGGFTHAFWIHNARQFYIDKGYSVTIEQTINGKSIDVVARKLRECLAVEIELTTVHTLHNITKDLATGVITKVVIAYKDKDTLKKAEKEFKKLNIPKDKVHFQLLADFLKGK